MVICKETLSRYYHDGVARKQENNMCYTSRLLMGVMIVAFLGGIAQAAAWRVEQDGSGEFTVIQEAVDAAAHGDTILIGPGHYREMRAFDIPGTGNDIQVAAYWENDRALTFIGSGPDEVLVGPDNYTPQFAGPMGIYQRGESPLRVSGISFQNFDHGIFSNGDIGIEGCRVSGTQGGILLFGFGSGVGRISNCEFYHQQFGGVGIGVWDATQMTIENCYFEDEDFYLQGVPDATVTGCEFVGRVGSFVASDGVFSNNQATISSNKVLYVSSGSQVLVKDSVFSVSSTGSHNISIFESDTTVELIGNVFNGGDYAAMDIAVCPTVFGSGNHFIKGSSQYTLNIQYCGDYFAGNIDLRNNYWGTDDPDQVAQWIWDGTDDPEIYLVVQYDPIADGPLPTESISLDSFKAMYR